jgi:hypothetical protein
MHHKTANIIPSLSLSYVTELQSLSAKMEHHLQRGTWWYTLEIGHQRGYPTCRLMLIPCVIQFSSQGVTWAGTLACSMWQSTGQPQGTD